MGSRKTQEEIDSEARITAFLVSQGMEEKAIAARVLGKSAATVTRRVERAKRKGWLVPVRPRYRFASEKMPRETVEAIQEQCWPMLNKIKSRLAQLAHARGVTAVRHIAVFHSGSEDTDPPRAWDRRVERFGRLAASRVEEIIAHMQLVGVTWGKTLASLRDGLRERNTRKNGEPVQFIPVCGEPLKEPIPDLSSSTLAATLGETVNSRPTAMISLGPVPAFIPRKFDEAQVKTISDFLASMAGYAGVFLGNEPLAAQLDTIITSLGFVSEKTKGRWLEDRLEAEEMTWQRLSDVVVGDIGGVLVPKPELKGADRKEVSRMNSRWTGIKREHFRRIAQNASTKHPGVIALAIGKAKAKVVIECVGLINELLIDHDLAQELDRVLPA